MLSKIETSPGLRWVAVAAWMAMIFFLSAQSQLPNLTPDLPGLVEISGHLLAYAGLAALFWWALRGRAGVRYPATWALIFAVLYGMTDEFHQSFVPGRTMSSADLLVDLIGASLALVIANQVIARRLRARGAQQVP
jgi:VanZ family protein